MIMKAERKLVDIGDGVNEVMFAFLKGALSDAFDTEEETGCVWFDKNGQIAEVLFDRVNLYHDEQVMHYQGYSIELKVRDLHAVCEIKKTK